MSRRGDFEAMFLVVSACNKLKMSHVTSNTGLNYHKVAKLVAKAMDLGLVVAYSHKGRNFYSKTEKGLKFLKCFREILVMLGRNDLYVKT